MSDELAKWYVVHTYSGYENKVKATLERVVDNRGLSDVICEVKVPMITQASEEEPQKMADHKLFPGYVLVRMVMTDESWFVVRNTRGVTGFVGPGSKPVPLTVEEVRMAMGSSYSEDSGNGFEVGQKITVVDGPLSGFEGFVQEVLADKKRIKVQVSMFGRETSVELLSNQIKHLTED